VAWLSLDCSHTHNTSTIYSYTELCRCVAASRWRPWYSRDKLETGLACMLMLAIPRLLSGDSLSYKHRPCVLMLAPSTAQKPVSPVLRSNVQASTVTAVRQGILRTRLSGHRNSVIVTVLWRSEAVRWWSYTHRRPRTCLTTIYVLYQLEPLSHLSVILDTYKGPPGDCYGVLICGNSIM
jgi:hypothetical protein